jgi:nitrate/TMAO reductase-like tetraheme cytochrome c subunit
LVFAAFTVTVLGVTSARWFCANGCHKVQDDTVTAYEHGTHARISCMACHMPVNANPAIFMLHKVDALRELALAVTNTFELPLNPDDEVSLTMPTNQCTQCHNLGNRQVSPSKGFKIDHKAHLDKGITCTTCHNRIGHNEDFPLTLTTPRTGKPNRKHPNFMVMTACFRCHGQEPGSPAPGTCSVCHQSGFEFLPDSHREQGFLPTKHAELARDASAEVARTFKETGEPTATAELKSEWLKPAAASNETTGQRLVALGSVYSCGTCHSTTFCDDCHARHGNVPAK